MMNRSSAMRLFSKEQKKAIVGQIDDVESDKAQQLYGVLLQEQQRYGEIEAEYLKNTSKIMLDFENDVTGMKIQAMRAERETAEAKVAAKEDEAAQNILKSLS